ncbi:MAG TPA: EAL domain-containing protein [Mycobacteriales bacterium]|jgi:diguanylate cyclase (GGDEF)-like protein|nr:EAL domain-containing protein [Mycobacteriales bacterium]
MLPVLALGGAEAMLTSFTWSLGQLPVATSVLDPAGRVVRVNAAFCELLGCTEGELLGQQMAALAGAGPSTWRLPAPGVERQDTECWRVHGAAGVDLLVARLGVADARGACWVLQQAVVRVPGTPTELTVRQAADLGELWTRLSCPASPEQLGKLTVDALGDALGGTVTLYMPDVEDSGLFEAVALRSFDEASRLALSRVYALFPQRFDGALVGPGSTPGPRRVLSPFDTFLDMSPYREWMAAYPPGAGLFVPVQDDDRVVGVLGLVRQRPEPAYDESEVALVAKVAQRLAPALDRARHLRLERYTAGRTAGLAAVGNACGAVLNHPKAVAPAAARAVSEVMGLACLIWHVDEVAGRLGRFVLHAPGGKLMETTWQVADPGELVDRVIREGRLHLGDPDELEVLAKPYTDVFPGPVLTPTSAVYGVRLEARGNVLGVLCMHDKSGPLTLERRRLVDALAERAALALDNAVLLDVARERGRQQQALAEIGAATLSTDTEQVLQLAVRTVAEVLELPLCSIEQRTADDTFVLHHCTDSRVPLGSSRSVGPQQGLAIATRTGRPVFVPDYRLPDVVDERCDPRRRGMLSGAVLPLRVDDRVWGALTLQSSQLRRFSGTELDFFEALTTVLAGALQREAIERRQVYEATHDALTGLPNRALLRQDLVRALGAEGDGQRVVALLLLDLDDFKDVNDSLGHAAGDDVLTELARRLRAAVGPGPTVSRLGGDEFAVCLTGCRDEAEAVGVAESVLLAMTPPFSLPGIDVLLTTSIGVAVAPAHGTDADRLLRYADMAMYRAKSVRSGWAMYDPALDRARSERLALLTELRAVVSGGGLLVHYQPLVDLRTGRVSEVEALVRWQHPRRGLLAAGAFVPLAEQSGLIEDLTLQVATQAAAQARAWRLAGTPCDIAVNVSPVVLRRPVFWRELRQVFVQAEGGLTMEVTESALVGPRAHAAVLGFAEAGVHVAIDDFGSGYAALSGLMSLPVSRLKLDAEFTAGVERHDRAALVIGGTVALAHGLGLDVVAEGVETEPVAQALRELDVDIAQGFLYGSAVPPEQLRLTPG